MLKINDRSYITTFQAAEMLNITPDYVRRLIMNGDIQAEKLGHNWIIRPHHLKKFARQRFPRPKQTEQQVNGSDQ